jgi:hypothetical protein
MNPHQGQRFLENSQQLFRRLRWLIFRPHPIYSRPLLNNAPL